MDMILYTDAAASAGEVGLIDAESMGTFQSLLLPEVRAALERGEPLLTLGWSVNRTAAGALSGFLEGGNFEILSLFVSPEYRRQGGGSLLLSCLSSLAEGAAENITLSFASAETAHGELEEFLKARGFREESRSELPLYRCTLGQVSQSDLLRDVKSPKSFRSFSECGAEALRMAEKRALFMDYPLPEGGFSAPGLDMNLSVAYENQGEITAWTVLTREEDGSLTMAGAVNESGKPLILLGLFREALRRCVSALDPGTWIYFPITDDTAGELVRMILPEAEQVSRRYVRKTAEEVF